MWPLITHSSPSSTAVVRSPVGSAPETSGSVIEKNERAVPSTSGFRKRSFCSSVPNMCRISPLPASGAWQLKTSCAHMLRPISSFRSAYSMNPEPLPPASGGRCGAQIPAVLRLRPQLLDHSVGRLVLARERGLVRIDVLLHERAHLGAARGHIGLEREVGHQRESARVGVRKPGPERDLPRRRRGVAASRPRSGSGGARDARAGAVRLRRRRRRLRGDGPREPRGVRAAPPAAADAGGQRRAGALDRGARPALGGARSCSGRSACSRSSIPRPSSASRAPRRRPACR